MPPILKNRPLVLIVVIFSTLYLYTGRALYLSEANGTGSPLSNDQRSLQVLNRLSFGPRPGDVERLKKTGIPAYIEEQLSPEKLDDSACDHELKRYAILGESINSLLMEYPQPGINLLRPDLRGKRLSPQKEGEAYGLIYGMVNDLAAAKLTRAVLSQRQLFEVMVDFWYNHFNVDFNKDGIQWYIGAYERDAIRPHALGKFRDLLGAVAKSPAMLLYLDNNSNHADPSFKPVAMAGTDGQAGGMMMQAPPGMGTRINENYGRELLELHTLGVDGGYTQKDVMETARVFTGWAVAGISSDAEPATVAFVFKSWHHDTNPKVILGQTYDQGSWSQTSQPGVGANGAPAQGGVSEGEAVLTMLCQRPETARFIARKLCQRFLDDDPPQPLVARVAAKFLASHGDIKETLRELFNSPEFLDPHYYRAKLKTPLEFVASALRATGSHPSEWAQTIASLETMGQPLYRCEPPTGYAQTASAWVSSTSLLARTNFSSDLVGGPLPESVMVSVNRDGNSLENACQLLLGGDVSEATRLALGKETGVDRTKKLLALVLASPDFQRR